jgi:hypothetical protein
MSSIINIEEKNGRYVIKLGRTGIIQYVCMDEPLSDCINRAIEDLNLAIALEEDYYEQ